MAHLSWSPVDKDFEKIGQSMKSHTEDFEAGARLANVKATKIWQDNILERLPKNDLHDSSSGNTSASSLVSTLPFPRNVMFTMFTGRDDILQDINRILQLSRADETETETVRSVALYGMGGVGKTQIALEYAYRFRNSYSHTFWVKCETEVELRHSFTALVEGLVLSP
ncbi:hypothetical protein QQX98_010725 [Neonectria punicea]|uniref:NB-ARC domain-containing protein n=1 Tax=Neonectria punicea TaxID=979145 RepID=A0ABR1GNJ9_9HYPO